MDDLDQLRSSAAALLAKAQEGSVSDLANAVDKAAAVQRLLADLETARATLRKTELEETQLAHQNRTTSSREKAERRKDYVTLLAPLVTVLTLAATLLAQNWQFLRSERDKADAAKEAQWQDAVKAISEATHVPQALIILQPFLTSPVYGSRAHQTAEQLAINGADLGFLDEVLGSAFVPAGWNNFDSLLRIDRALSSKGFPLYAKSWDGEKDVNDLKKLSAAEVITYQYVDGAVPRLSTQLGSILKSPRPPGIVVDLSNSYIKQADWSGTDLSGAILENVEILGVDLKDADLSRVTRFNGLQLFYVAWWEARSISPELLTYLQQRFPCDPHPKFAYGPRGEKAFTAQDCTASFARLHTQAGTPPPA